jgi:hypothetical protein
MKMSKVTKKSILRRTTSLKTDFLAINFMKKIDLVTFAFEIESLVLFSKRFLVILR